MVIEATTPTTRIPLGAQTRGFGRNHALLMLLMLFASVGCRRSSQSAEMASVEPSSLETKELSFANQIEAGRRGETDRIELFRSVVREQDVKALETSDHWLEVLILDAGELEDAGVEHLSVLPSLWHLRLRDSPVSDTGMESLSECRGLRVLNLPQCAATSSGVAKLAALPELTQLRLGGQSLGPNTASSVAGIRTLKSVHLIGVPIDDDGLKQIASLPQLQSLYVDDSEVSQAGWDWLFDSHPGLHVHINQRHHDRDVERFHADRQPDDKLSGQPSAEVVGGPSEEP